MIMEFSSEEISMLMDDGYAPGFMMDLEVGDLVAIPPVTRTTFDGATVPIKTLVVQRVMTLKADYMDYEDNGMIQHRVITFIGLDIYGLPQHCSYGNTYPCFIKKEVTNVPG